MSGQTHSKTQFQKTLELAERRIDEGLRLVLTKRARILESVRRAVLDGKQEGVESLQADLWQRKKSIESHLHQLRTQDPNPEHVTSKTVYSKGKEFSRRAEKMLSEIEALRTDKEVARMYVSR